MAKTLNAKELRSSLPAVVARVRAGERLTLVYRSRPVLQLVPLDGPADDVPLEDDALYGAAALGRSSDGASSRDHDEVLYGSRTKTRRR